MKVFMPLFPYFFSPSILLEHLLCRIRNIFLLSNLKIKKINCPEMSFFSPITSSEGKNVFLGPAVFSALWVGWVCWDHPSKQVLSRSWLRGPMQMPMQQARGVY